MIDFLKLADTRLASFSAAVIIRTNLHATIID